MISFLRCASTVLFEDALKQYLSSLYMAMATKGHSYGGKGWTALRWTPMTSMQSKASQCTSMQSLKDRRYRGSDWTLDLLSMNVRNKMAGT